MGFGWKFQVKRDKPAISAKIEGEYWYSKSFLVLRILSTSTESQAPVLKDVFCKTREKFNFFKNGKTVICRNSECEKSKNFLDLG